MSVWIAYIIGQLVHWYLKADATVKSASPVNTYREWVTRNRRALVARLFIATLGFVAWDYYPDFVTHIGQILATYLTPGALRSVIEKLQFPLNIVTACAYGYLADSLLDKLVNRFPMLAGEIPKVNGDSKPADEQKPPDPPNATGASAGKAAIPVVVCVWLVLTILLLLAMFAPRAHGQTTIAPDTVKPKNVIMQAGGATGVDNSAAAQTKPAKTGTGAPAAGDCDAANEVGRKYVRTDAQAVKASEYTCANTGVATYAWELTGDGGSTVTVNGAAAAASTVDFDSATPAAPANSINARFQKDALTPTNISANVPYDSATLDVAGGNLKVKDLGIGTGQLAAGAVTEAKQTLADNTIGNVSTAMHGYVPKAPNVATQFLDGTGAFSTPSGGLTVLDKQDTVAGADGNSTDKTIFTYSMPSGTLAAGKCVRVTFYFHRTVGVGTPTMRIKFGGTFVNSAVITNSAAQGKWSADICNNNGSTTAQWGIGQNFDPGGGLFSFNRVAPAENTNSGSAIAIVGSFNVATGTSMGGDGWIVEKLP